MFQSIYLVRDQLIRAKSLLQSFCEKKKYLKLVKVLLVLYCRGVAGNRGACSCEGIARGGGVVVGCGCVAGGRAAAVNVA